MLLHNPPCILPSSSPCLHSCFVFSPIKEQSSKFTYRSSLQLFSHLHPLSTNLTSVNYMCPVFLLNVLEGCCYNESSRSIRYSKTITRLSYSGKHFLLCRCLGRAGF